MVMYRNLLDIIKCLQKKESYFFASAFRSFGLVLYKEANNDCVGKTIYLYIIYSFLIVNIGYVWSFFSHTRILQHIILLVFCNPSLRHLQFQALGRVEREINLRVAGYFPLVCLHTVLFTFLHFLLYFSSFLCFWLQQVWKSLFGTSYEFLFGLFLAIFQCIHMGQFIWKHSLFFWNFPCSYCSLRPFTWSQQIDKEIMKMCRGEKECIPAELVFRVFPSACEEDWFTIQMVYFEFLQREFYPVTEVSRVESFELFSRKEYETISTLLVPYIPMDICGEIKNYLIDPKIGLLEWMVEVLDEQLDVLAIYSNLFIVCEKKNLFLKVRDEDKQKFRDFCNSPEGCLSFFYQFTKEGITYRTLDN